MSLLAITLGGITRYQWIVYAAAQYLDVRRGYCVYKLFACVCLSSRHRRYASTEVLNHFDTAHGVVRATAGNYATAGIFVTYPQGYLNAVGGTIDQVDCVCVCAHLLVR